MRPAWKAFMREPTLEFAFRYPESIQKLPKVMRILCAETHLSAFFTPRWQFFPTFVKLD